MESQLLRWNFLHSQPVKLLLCDLQGVSCIDEPSVKEIPRLGGCVSASFNTFTFNYLLPRSFVLIRSTDLIRWYHVSVVVLLPREATNSVNAGSICSTDFNQLNLKSFRCPGSYFSTTQFVILCNWEFCIDSELLTSLFLRPSHLVCHNGEKHLDFSHAELRSVFSLRLE